MKRPPVVVGISGASGSLYGVRLIKALIESGTDVMVILSDAAKGVLSHEMGFDPGSDFIEFMVEYGIAPKDETRIEVLAQHQMASEPASGSFLHSGMAVCPCSMKTLSAIASGFADNLLTRSADVTLKENRPLILVPRETPYSLIHLKNMEQVTLAGGVILPPNPSFYSFPQTIDALVDTVVARIMDQLKVDHDLMSRWGD